MSIDLDLVMREQLLERRQKVATVISSVGPNPQLTSLLREVDAALARFESGTYGLCETCHDPVEADRLIANPVERFCLDHLSSSEQRDLEDDLSLAVQIQRGLLPKHDVRVDGWHLDYGYEPARLVSGDYVDIIRSDTRSDDEALYFVLGDVSGKGVAASMLAAKLHTVFRGLIPLHLGVDQIMERASRLFGDSTLPGQYATLICGRASKHGAVSICNAGHPPALLCRNGRIEQIAATGLPLGMFSNQKFSAGSLQLENGDTLILYTDGVIDSLNGHDEEYGMSRLIDLTTASSSCEPGKFVASCLSDVSTFRGARPRCDDISVMEIRRV